MKILNILLWVAQLLLAAGFAWAAYMKLIQPAGVLAGQWPWTAEYPGLVVLTGILDTLAATGLVLPTLLRIAPVWTIRAAAGTVALMAAAIVFHGSRSEPVGFNVFFGALAGFVWWGRMKAPLRPGK